MKSLEERELQWLEAFAQNHEFFASFLLHYKLKNYLENNQYYWLQLYINQAEENGDTLLDVEEITFLVDLKNFALGVVLCLDTSHRLVYMGIEFQPQCLDFAEPGSD